MTFWGSISDHFVYANYKKAWKRGQADAESHGSDALS